MLFSYAQQLRRSNYDIAINLRPDFWWGAALIYLAHIPRRVGYALPPGTPFLNHAVPFQAPELATVSNLRLASVALAALGHTPLAEPIRTRTLSLAILANAGGICQYSPTFAQRGYLGRYTNRCYSPRHRCRGQALAQRGMGALC